MERWMSLSAFSFPLDVTFFQFSLSCGNYLKQVDYEIEKQEKGNSAEGAGSFIIRNIACRTLERKNEWLQDVSSSSYWWYMRLLMRLLHLLAVNDDRERKKMIQLWVRIKYSPATDSKNIIIHSYFLFLFYMNEDAKYIFLYTTLCKLMTPAVKCLMALEGKYTWLRSSARQFTDHNDALVVNFVMLSWLTCQVNDSLCTLPSPPSPPPCACPTVVEWISREHETY